MNLSISRKLMVLAAVLCLAGAAYAQSAQGVSHMVPTGKGYGESADNAPPVVQGNELHGPSNAACNNPRNPNCGGGGGSGNGISYHGGPVMTAPTVNVYFIWYGNWTNGPKASDSQDTVSLLNALFGVNGLNNSGYEKINSTYTNGSGAAVSGSLVLAQSTTVSSGYSTSLSDSGVQSVVSNAISTGALPKDTNGVYFVLTSSDVNESSGFCTRYCGWHTAATIGGSDIKYSFVGNADRCPSACAAQTTSPNSNSGADAMASVMAHESEEAISDPDLNAWYDGSGNENADKCAWKWGPYQRATNGAAYNQTLAGKQWLIQMNWENARGGGCDQTLGGTFYTQ